MDDATQSLKGLIETYFNQPEPLHLPIPPDFDEAKYLATYPDVAGAVAEGRMTSGFEHYIRYGRAEGRERPTRLA